MKLSTFSARLAPVLPLLRCPLCGGALVCDGKSLICERNHCFDLSAKGYVNLAPSRDQAGEKYDAALFESRRQIFLDGFYNPVAEAMQGMLARRFASRAFSLLDVGCGEGFYARRLAQALPAATVLGMDLSRDAILAAARGGGEPRWFVADLKRLPIRDGALDVVVDALTPADYAEFRRVLAPGGELFKLIPGTDYLCEIRAALRDTLRNADYDNARVIEHLERSAEVLEQVTLRHTFALTPAQAACFARMTPMTFSVSPEALQAVAPREITLHLELLRCRMK